MSTSARVMVQCSDPCERPATCASDDASREPYDLLSSRKRADDRYQSHSRPCAGDPAASMTGCPFPSGDGPVGHTIVLSPTRLGDAHDFLRMPSCHTNFSIEGLALGVATAIAQRTYESPTT
jgi:hypothetical protein